MSELHNEGRITFEAKIALVIGFVVCVAWTALYFECGGADENAVFGAGKTFFFFIFGPIFCCAVTILLAKIAVYVLKDRDDRT